MVRVISQKFSPPRSRHSSGETDRDLAERTKVALSSLGGEKKVEPLEHNESSSDSFWDSEFDGEHYEAHLSETSLENHDVNGNNSSEKSDLQSKRKERRRERNKLSAQAYRKRRRNQSAKDQENMSLLESKNRQLHKLVEKLEKDREQGRQFLRGCPVPMPDFLISKPGQRTKKELNPVPEEPAVEEASGVYQDSSNSVPEQNVYSVQQFNTQPPSPPKLSQTELGKTSPANANVSFKKSDSLECNANVSQFSLFPAQILTADSLSQSTQSPQILVPAHTLIGASVNPPENSNYSACAFPAYVAVPVENPSQYYANANLNLNFSCPLMSGTNSISNSNEENVNETSGINTNSALGNELNLYAASKPMTIKTNTLVGLVQVEMCNSNGGNSNLNLNTAMDDNGNRNSNCDNYNANVTDVQKKSRSFQNLNLNINQKPESLSRLERCPENQSYDVKPNEFLHLVLAEHERKMDN